MSGRRVEKEASSAGVPSLADVVAGLKSLGDPYAVVGMKRFAVGGKHALGISIPVLRKLAKEIGRSHELARGLWATRIHEARILASMIDEPARVTESQMEEWVADFDSWDLTDQVSMNLFERLPSAWQKAVEWAGREPEFERRAGFALMACLAWHDKQAPAASFDPFFRAAEAASEDGRNFVKKAVSWALRNIGKRDHLLRERAMETARRIQACGSKTAKWIASDVLRELGSEAVRLRRPF